MAPTRGSGRRLSGVEPDWLTLGQAAKYLGVAQSTIRKWSDQGLLPAFYTPGGHRRFRRSDLDGFLSRSGPAGRPGPRVLIVDDDSRLRAHLRTSLEGEGYTVREAGSAEEGLAELAEASPDLVLLDVTTPEIDAGEMLRLVRDRHGVGAIPVVMFRGYAEDGADRTARRGAQETDAPTDPERLVESTKQLLSP